MEEVFEIVKRIIGLDRLVSIITDKLTKEYGVYDMSVSRVDDCSVVLIFKGKKEGLDKMENELRASIDQIFGKKVFVEVKLNG